MTVSLINSNSNERQIKIIATNGKDQDTIVFNKARYDEEYQLKYQENRSWILQKKKIYNRKNKERIADYHRPYYLEHKEDWNRKLRDYLRRKIG